MSSAIDISSTSTKHPEPVAPVPVRAAPADRTRSVQIVARSMLRRLYDEGFEPRHVVAFITELIALETNRRRASRETSSVAGQK